MTDEIPADIVRASKLLFNDLMRSLMGRGDGEAAIARAILAERQRCAKVASSRGWGASQPVRYGPHDEGGFDTADAIAQAILKGEIE